MKSIIVVLSCFFLAACARSPIPQSPKYVAPALHSVMPEAAPIKRVTAKNGWGTDEHLTSYEVGSEIVPYLRGNKGAWTYDIMESGRGSLNIGEYEDNWSIDCKADALTDKRACYISQSSTRLFVALTPSGKLEHVCVLGHDFPGRYAAIRADKKPAVRTHEDGCLPAAGIYQQIAKASTVTTRRYTWPNDYAQDITVKTEGIADAVSLARYIQKNIGSLHFQ